MVSERTASERTTSDKDVVYASPGNTDLELDVYRPAADCQARHTAILFFHGGGWRGGTREMMRPDARAMAALGYVGLPVQYRLVGDAPFPAQIEDVKAAIRWTRAHAGELDIDPTRIVLWGSSAGAHLSLLAAGTPDGGPFDAAAAHSSAVAAVIAVHPPVEFHVGEPGSRHTTSAAALLGEHCTPAQASAASPMSYVTAAFPPTLLLHGTYDRMVNHAASEALQQAMRAVKAPVEMHLFHGHNHGFGALPSMRERLAAEADYFLDRTVLDPAKYQAEALEFSLFARRAAAEQAAAGG